MNGKKILLVSSNQDEAITHWVCQHRMTDSMIDHIHIENLLRDVSIFDEINDQGANIQWVDADHTIYSNQTHTLLNRILHIDSDLFSSFHPQEKNYAKREFEAYLGFALNAFQSPQSSAVNGVCERQLSLPQQWQFVDHHLALAVPRFFWGDPRFNPMLNVNNVVHSDIYALLNWTVNSKTSTPSRFTFAKPSGEPVFIVCLGNKTRIANPNRLSNPLQTRIARHAQHLRQLLQYFMFEMLVFVDGSDITFGCININLLYFQKVPWLNDFLNENLLEEYQQCLN